MPNESTISAAERQMELRGYDLRGDLISVTDRTVVETKTGNATLSSGQSKLKADIDAGRNVTPVGQNAANAGLRACEPTLLGESA